MSLTITEEQPASPESALAAFAEATAQAIGTRYPGSPPIEVTFEAPRRPEFGDFSTNVAFALARAARSSPQNVATALVAELRASHPQLHALFREIEPTAGFINLRLAPTCWQSVVARIVREGERFGESPQNGTRVSLEFGSANPTGPLVIVQGRACSIG